MSSAPTAALLVYAYERSGTAVAALIAVALLVPVSSRLRSPAS